MTAGWGREDMIRVEKGDAERKKIQVSKWKGNKDRGRIRTEKGTERGRPGRIVRLNDVKRKSRGDREIRCEDMGVAKKAYTEHFLSIFFRR